MDVERRRRDRRKELIDIILEIIRLAVSMMLYMAVLVLATLAVSLLGVALYVVVSALCSDINKRIKSRRERSMR